MCDAGGVHACLCASCICVDATSCPSCSCPHLFPPHLPQVTSVLMDESSGQLFTGSFDGTVRVWSCTTGEVRGWYDRNAVA